MSPILPAFFSLKSFFREPEPILVGKVQDSMDEAGNADPLAPAMGIMAGLELSIVLWCLIVLALYWIRLHLSPHY